MQFPQRSSSEKTATGGMHRRVRSVFFYHQQDILPQGEIKYFSGRLRRSFSLEGDNNYDLSLFKSYYPWHYLTTHLIYAYVDFAAVYTPS